MKFLDRLEMKHPRWGIKNLMMHVSLLTGIVYVLSLFRSDIFLYLYLSRDLVLDLQLWRLVTFVLIPNTGLSIIFFLITLYFYYFLGTALETTWGTLKFNIYYFTCMIATILVAFLFGGFYTGFYVNLSIFLAFAYLYPNKEFLLFFVLPVKVKYLAYLDLAFLAFSFFTNGWNIKLSILASLAGFLLFFSGDMIQRLKMWIRRQKYKNKF